MLFTPIKRLIHSEAIIAFHVWLETKTKKETQTHTQITSHIKTQKCEKYLFYKTSDLLPTCLLFLFPLHVHFFAEHSHAVIVSLSFFPQIFSELANMNDGLAKVYT